MCVNSVGAILILSTISIFVTTCTFIFYYIRFGPLTPTLDSAILPIFGGNIIFFISLSVAGYILFKKYYYKVLPIIFVEFGFFTTLVLGLMVVWKFWWTPTIPEFLNSFQSHMDKYDRPPAFLQYLQESPNLNCCGVLSYMDYINYHPQHYMNMMTYDTDFGRRARFTQIPESCCKAPVSECTAFLRSIPGRKEKPSGGESLDKVFETIGDYINTRGCLENGIEALGRNDVNQLRIFLSQLATMCPIYALINILTFNLHLYYTVTGKDQPAIFSCFGLFYNSKSATHSL